MGILACGNLCKKFYVKFYFNTLDKITKLCYPIKPKF
nr:MAG TPA: hypothetical protein [Caudoviricetes sp.]